MFCLFLGLSLSLFSRRKRSILGCSVGASLPPSGNGWPSSPSWIITLAEPQDLLSHLWHTRERLLWILWALLAPKIDVRSSEPA